MISQGVIALTVAWTLTLAQADTLSVSFDQSPRFPVYDYGSEVAFSFFVRRDNPAKPDKIVWKIVDMIGKEIESGSIKVPEGDAKVSVGASVKNLSAGYMELRASLQGAGVELPRLGSRPAGMATFGILSPVKAVTPKRLDEARFGVQGTNFIKSGVFMNGDPYDPLYRTLGIHWVNLSREWAQAEPDRPGQYLESLKKRAEEATKNTPSSDPMATNGLVPLVCASFIPWWSVDFPVDYKVDKGDIYLKQAFPPKDLALYTNYMRDMAADFAAMRKQNYATLRDGYYQIGWEPDWHWKGTNEQFVAQYAAAYRGIHEGDPNAVVLGPGYGVLAKGVEKLEQLLPLGLGKSLDGIAIHAYYLPFGNPKATEITGKLISPEKGGNIENLRKLRALMKQYMKPGAKLFQTEWGLDYRTSYKNLDISLLKIHAAYIIRGHILLLGEGCEVTYLFYTADYGNLDKPGEDGYGLCFNLTMPNPSFGATTVSPKPVFMAACTMTRLLEGTKTIGPANAGNDQLCAYVFRRENENVLALWAKEGAVPKVKIATAGEKITLVDFMGNVSVHTAKGGVIEIGASEYPVYLLGVAENPFASLNSTPDKKK